VVSIGKSTKNDFYDMIGSLPAADKSGQCLSCSQRGTTPSIQHKTLKCCREAARWIFR